MTEKHSPNKAPHVGAESGVVMGTWEPRGRAYTLRLKREIRESQLAYARSVGDAAKVAECERALVTIARWEREDES